MTLRDLEHQAAAFQQAAWRFGAISTNGGSSAHFSNASGQRARKRQPVGGLSSDGGRPGMPLSRSLGEAHADLGQRAEQELRVRMARVLGDLRRGRLLDELARRT